jgi:hypothetical protein
MPWCRTCGRAGKPLRIWCNAASTGEEPYSLAMTAVEALGRHPRCSIVASDIDTKVLDTARRGVYAADSRGLARSGCAATSCAAPAPTPASSACARTGAAAGVPHFNLMSTSWSAWASLRHDLLPQRDDLLRQPHAAQGARTHARRAQAGRGCSMSATPRTSPTRATCSGCAARPSTSESEPASARRREVPRRFKSDPAACADIHP